MKNRITEILGSDLPILQGAMRLISLGEMAAAVSAAGAFGVIGASGLEGPTLQTEIRKAKSLTDQPFGINIPIYRPNASEALEIAIEEGVRTIISSAGDPRKLAGRVKEAGLKMVQVVATVEMAKKAEAAGADAVIAIGAEGGGHVGRDEISALVLIPQVVDAVQIPVIAAGGIGDARGWVAAFALGAEGIQMGTRFLATDECPISEVYKRAILEANDHGTMIVARKGFPLRLLRNKAALAVQALEEKGANQGEVNVYVDSLSKSPEENFDNRLMSAGEVCGMIHQIFSIEALIPKMVGEAREIATCLGEKFLSP